MGDLGQDDDKQEQLDDKLWGSDDEDQDGM